MAEHARNRHRAHQAVNGSLRVGTASTRPASGISSKNRSRVRRHDGGAGAQRHPEASRTVDGTGRRDGHGLVDGLPDVVHQVGAPPRPDDARAGRLRRRRAGAGPTRSRGRHAGVGDRSHAGQARRGRTAGLRTLAASSARPLPDQVPARARTCWASSPPPGSPRRSARRSAWSSRWHTRRGGLPRDTGGRPVREDRLDALIPAAPPRGPIGRCTPPAAAVPRVKPVVLRSLGGTDGKMWFRWPGTPGWHPHP